MLLNPNVASIIKRRGLWDCRAEQAKGFDGGDEIEFGVGVGGGAESEDAGRVRVGGGIVARRDEGEWARWMRYSGEVDGARKANVRDAEAV